MMRKAWFAGWSAAIRWAADRQDAMRAAHLDGNSLVWTEPPQPPNPYPEIPIPVFDLKAPEGQRFTAEQYTAIMASVSPMLQALADVRTLDEYVAALTGSAPGTPDEYFFWKVRPWRGRYDPPFICQAIRGSNGYVYADLGEGGATPDEARAKAAAWVREQGK